MEKKKLFNRFIVCFSLYFSVDVCYNFNKNSDKEESFMFDGIENLKIISVGQRENRPYVKIECRKTHTFFIRAHGAVLYDFDGEKLLSREGEVTFVPKGATYEAGIVGEGAGYTAINFEADFSETPRPRSYSLEKLYDADYMVSNISDMYKFGTQADRYRCMSFVYSLLAHLSDEEHARHDKEKFNMIAPAVAYLKNHIYDSTLKVDKLHRLCGISGTYFRRIFALRFGKTPQRYILSRRLSHAKSIIAGGDFDTISEVALTVGFNDPLYFSKAYKKEYGKSPSEACREDE